MNHNYGHFNDQIRNVNCEILDCKKKLMRLRKMIPVGILMVIGFSLLIPYIPNKSNRIPMIDTWGYQNAVIFSAVICFIVYLVSYSVAKNKLEKDLRELKLKKHLIEKDRPK